jgi:hypothetical protein
MAASLRPAVRGATPKALRRVTAMHGTGLLFGALFAALVLLVAGSALSAVGLRPAVEGMVVIALTLAIAQCLGLRVPQSRWQVPEYWRRTFDLDVLPLAYGALLGVGIFTAVVVGAFWVFMATTLLGSPLIAMLGWAAYAFGRGLGFRVVLQIEPLERIFLNARQRHLLIVTTALLACLVVVSQ